MNLSSIIQITTEKIAPLSITEPLIANGAITESKLSSNLGYVPCGTIIAYAKNGTPPGGWIQCNGALVSKLLYSELHLVIGTTYGDETSDSFRVPDLRNNFIRGYGTSAQESVTDVGAATSGSATITGLEKNTLALIRVGYVVTACTVSGLVGARVTAISSTTATIDDNQTKNGTVTLDVASTTSIAACSVTFQRSFGGLESPYAGYNTFYAYADDGDSQGGSFGAINSYSVNGVWIVKFPQQNKSIGTYNVPVIANDARPSNLAMTYCIKI